MTKLEILKKQYFKLAEKERRPMTPKITEKLDKLEKEIRKEIKDQKK